MSAHGRYNRYNTGCRCDDCRQAATARQRLQQEKRRARPADLPHGTPSGYANWECRCQQCHDAYFTPERAARQRVYTARWLAKRKREAAS